MGTDEAALDRLLATDPNNIPALIAKGDLRSAAGDDRGSAAFYKAALQAAAAARGPLPMALKPGIERAQRQLAAAEVRFGQYLEDRLTAAGFPPSRRPPRFQESLDLMTGRRTTRLQLQQPTAYYYPGLPQRRFYERHELPWAEQLEAAAGTILAELTAWLESGGDGFAPYLVSNPNRPPRHVHGLTDNPAWSTLYIWDQGGSVPHLAPHFPRTLELLLALPLPHISVRAPSLLFSRLSSGSRIPAHHGMLNARLICHLPLIVPPGCGFRVGGETRHWEPGKLLVFDDTVEHEAWNEGHSDRIILIFDVWRPELVEEERRAITALFEAIDGYGS